MVFLCINLVKLQKVCLKTKLRATILWERGTRLIVSHEFMQFTGTACKRADEGGETNLVLSLSAPLEEEARDQAPMLFHHLDRPGISKIQK